MSLSRVIAVCPRAARRAICAAVAVCAMNSFDVLGQSSTVPPETCNGVQLIAPRAIVRTLIPSEDLGVEWTQPGFDDKNWIRGLAGVGYEVGSSPYAPGLILYHTLDKIDLSGATVKDVSGPTLHPGTIAGTLSNVPGRIGQALDFKGEAASHVRVAHHAELDPGTGSFTVALWFRPVRGATATAGFTFTETLIAKQGVPGATGQTGGGWSIYRTQAGTFVQTVSSAGTRTVPVGPSAASQWNHAVLVVNRSTTQLIGYLNGKRIGVAALSSLSPESIGSAADLLEGRDLAGNAPFMGTLDDVAIWSRAMTDNQVQELFSIGQQGKSFMDGTLFPAAGKLYAGLIGTDVLTQMKGVSATAYIRVPFNVPLVPTLATGLQLRVQYDDGFVAYLNGAEVARRNAPDVLDDLATSQSARPDNAALIPETIDLGQYIGLLKPGGNVLAFHALNSSPDADRFLLNPVQLCLQIDRPTTTGGECIRETNGKDFWIAFPENYAQEPDTPLRLTLCITGPPQTTGVVEIPGLKIAGFPRNFTLPAAGALNMALPPAVELSGADNIETKGVHITASANVAVYGTTRMDYTTDTFLGLPTKCLGTEYLVSSYKNVFQGIPILNGTQFAIVAVADATEITIVPPSAVGAHAANQPYVIKLNRGETYQLRNEANQPADLTGTHILATKPIGVFGSHRCANVQSLNQFFCDTVVEELLPVSSWGTSFFVVPLATRKNDTVRVLSGGPNNLVTMSTTSGSQSFTLQQAEYKDVVLELPTRFVCRAPTSVMQFSNSSDADHVADADPFMAMIQPSTTWLSEYRICTPSELDFSDNYINLIATSQTLLDNTLINAVPVGAWPVADIAKGALPSGHVFARIRLQPRTAYFIDGRSPLGLTAYGFSEFDSYGYPGGMRFQDTFPPIISCPGQITVGCSSVAGAVDCLAPVPDLTLKSYFFDDCTPEGQLVVTQTPKAGDLLKPGAYPVTITATDAKGNKAQCVVTLVVDPNWEQQQFGPSIVANPSLQATVWGANADPDNDGVPNALEKAVGSDPNKPTSLNTLLQVAPGADPQGTAFLTISVPRLTEGTGAVVQLEGVGALDGSPWQGGADIFEELPAKTTPLPGGKYERATFKARHTEGTTRAYFFRLTLKP